MRPVAPPVPAAGQYNRLITDLHHPAGRLHSLVARLAPLMHDVGGKGVCLRCGIGIYLIFEIFNSLEF